MKKTFLTSILIFFLCFSFSISKAQTATSAPNLEAVMIKLLGIETAKKIKNAATATHSANNLKESVKILKQLKVAAEVYQDIRGSIKTSKKVVSMFKLQADVIIECTKYTDAVKLKEVDYLFKPGEIERIKNQYKSILSDSTTDLEMFTYIVTPGNTKMDDFGRIKTISRLVDSMERRLYRAQRLTKRLKQIIVLRKNNVDNKDFLIFMYG